MFVFIGITLIPPRVEPCTRTLERAKEHKTTDTARHTSRHYAGKHAAYTCARTHMHALIEQSPHLAHAIHWVDISVRTSTRQLESNSANKIFIFYSKGMKACVC
jgi:hypothetical protein